jgi:uncharacterized SAM-binding protein YcdF (DUF218 family)
MYEIAKLVEYLLSPLTMAMATWLVAAMCLMMKRRRAAVVIATLAFVGLWIGSMPVVAQALLGGLENRYPALPVAATPTADAIIVLGGSVSGRHPPARPSLGLNSASSRVWYAAELYRAGKAKVVVVAAGGRPPATSLQQAEADAVAEMLVVLGVPRSAIHLETESINTRENAANTRPILVQLGVRRVLLITSAQHMPRAVKTFYKVWAHSGIEITAAPTDVTVPASGASPFLWIPSPNALQGVSRALKEYAGIAALAIM